MKASGGEYWHDKECLAEAAQLIGKVRRVHLLHAPPPHHAAPEMRPHDAGKGVKVEGEVEEGVSGRREPRLEGGGGGDMSGRTILMFGARGTLCAGPLSKQGPVNALLVE